VYFILIFKAWLQHLQRRILEDLEVDFKDYCCTPDTWLLLISLVWFSLMHSFKKVLKYLPHATCMYYYLAHGIPQNRVMRNSNGIPSAVPLTRFSRNAEFRNSKNARYAGTRCTRMKKNSFECPKSIRNYKKNNA